MKKEFEQVCDALVKMAEDAGYDNYWFFNECITGNKLVETFFEEYFRQNEGTACCVDKAHYVVGGIKKMIELKHDIKLQQTYREYQEIGGDIGGIKELDEIAYWCPKTLNTADEALRLFYKNTIQNWKNGGILI